MGLKKIATLSGHKDRVWDVAWNPSGSLIASCGGDKSIRIWKQESAASWVCVASLEEAHGRTVRRVSWSPDGKYIAAASFDATVSIWEQNSGEFECIATLEGHENEVKCVCWDSSGSLLATCSRDKSVWVWEFGDEGAEIECLAVCQGHQQDCKFVLFHPTRQALLSASYDDTIRVWLEEDDDWYASELLKGHTSTVWALAFSPDAELLASCSDDRSVIIWSFDPALEEGKRWAKHCSVERVHKRSIYSISWSKDNLIATGAADDAIVIQKIQSNTNTGELELSTVHREESAHSSDVNCVAWDSSGKYLASAGDDCKVNLWVFDQ